MRTVKGANSPLVALQGRALLQALNSAAQKYITQGEARAHFVPGLPLYFTKGGLQQLLSVMQKSLALAAVFGINPVLILKLAAQHVNPAVSRHLLQHLAIYDPSVLPTNTRHKLLKQTVRLGTSFFPALGLRIAAPALGLLSHLHHIPPKAVELMNDLLKLHLTNEQLACIMSYTPIITKYAPYVLSNSTTPPGNGLDAVEAIQSILQCLNEIQVQTICAIAVQLLTWYQPAAQAWFPGLQVQPVRKYLCARGFQLQGGMCAGGNIKNSTNRNTSKNVNRDTTKNSSKNSSQNSSKNSSKTKSNLNKK